MCVLCLLHSWCVPDSYSVLTHVFCRTANLLLTKGFACQYTYRGQKAYCTCNRYPNGTMPRHTSRFPLPSEASLEDSGCMPCPAGEDIDPRGIVHYYCLIIIIITSSHTTYLVQKQDKRKVENINQLRKAVTKPLNIHSVAEFWACVVANICNKMSLNCSSYGYGRWLVSRPSRENTVQALSQWNICATTSSKTTC